VRESVAFTSSGLTLRGWLYRPRSATPSPIIVMSHGFSAVKEMGLPPFAERFCQAGFAVLVFDYRCLGESDGAERGRIVAQEQHDDLRAALTYVSGLAGVDPSRIGVWGSSYSGGHALYIGALDPRIKVIVAQVPAIAIARSLVAIAGVDGFKGYLDLFAADHAARERGEASGRIPVVAPEGEPAVLATADSYAWFVKSHPSWLEHWINHTTIESVARMAEYVPAAFIDLAAPKPLLILAGETDSLIPIDQVREAFARAGEPKRLEVHPCGHFDFYPGGAFHEQAASAATDWFSRWLRP